MIPVLPHTRGAVDTLTTKDTFRIPCTKLQALPAYVLRNFLHSVLEESLLVYSRHRRIEYSLMLTRYLVYHVGPYPACDHLATTSKHR